MTEAEELAQWRRVNDADVLISALFLYELDTKNRGRPELAARAAHMRKAVEQMMSTMDDAYAAEEMKGIKE